MKIKYVTVCGSGVLGAQIAFQTAFHGFEVTVYDIKQEYLDSSRKRFVELGNAYMAELGASKSSVGEALERIGYSIDMATSVKLADLVIEAIPESTSIKKEFYSRLGKVAPAETIFCTNSSTLLPSTFADDTGRPDRFLALHFANRIRKNNTAEIMGHIGTSQAAYDTVVEFANAIGMVALPLKKEQPGYILNSLQVPWLLAAMELYAKGVADAHIIDKTWMIATQSGIGPFGNFDLIGFNTVYNIAMIAAGQGNESMALGAELIKKRFIDKGHLGVSTGRGFYSYPNPAFEHADFLK